MDKTNCAEHVLANLTYKRNLEGGGARGRQMPLQYIFYLRAVFSYWVEEGENKQIRSIQVFGWCKHQKNEKPACK